MEAFTTVVVLEGDSRLVRHSRGALFLTDMALIVVVSIFRGDFIVDVVVSVQNTKNGRNRYDHDQLSRNHLPQLVVQL